MRKIESPYLISSDIDDFEVAVVLDTLEDGSILISMGDLTFEKEESRKIANWILEKTDEYSQSTVVDTWVKEVLGRKAYNALLKNKTLDS